MTNYFEKPDKPICVAVAFDDTAPVLIRTAADYAKRFGSSLFLIHVTEPWVGAVGMGILPVPEVSDSIQQELVARAKQSLQELAQHAAGVDTDCDVRVGVVGDEVIASALHHDAKMIFIGHQSREKSFIPRGFSSTLSILGNAPIPVMTISKSRPLNLAKAHLSVMVADDLSEPGELVLVGGCSLAAGFGADLHHVHANGISKENLAAALTMAAAAGKGTPSSAISSDEYMTALHETIKKRMKERLTSVKNRIEGNLGKIEQHVINGNPDDAVAECVESLKPDILAFGRHHTFHRKPFLIGRVPFHAMLDMPCPAIMVIPPEFKN